MNKPTRLALIFFLVLICVSVIAFVLMVPTIERRVRREIVTQLKDKLDAKVELRSVHLSSIWPLGLRIQGLKVLPKNELYRVELEQMNLRLRYLIATNLDVEIDQPIIYWFETNPPEKSANTKTTPPPASSSGAMPSAMLVSLPVQIRINDGKVIWRKDEQTNVELEKLSVKINKAKLLNEAYPIKFQISSALHYRTPWITGQTDIVSHSDDLRVGMNSITSKAIDLQLGGLDLRASGMSRFSQGLNDWIVGASIEDLTKLSKPPSFLPAQNWRGKIQIDVSYHSKMKDAQVQGNLQMDQVGMDLNWQAPEMSVKGPAKLNTHAVFKWQNSVYEVKDATVTADLTSAEVSYSNLFKKPAGTLLTVNFAGSVASNALDIKQLDLALFNLRAVAKGQMPFKGNGRIDFSTSRAELAGWEKLIPPLAEGGALKGGLEVSGSVAGSFEKPKEMAIELNKLSLKDARGVINYKSSDNTLTVKGPVTADLNGRLSSLGSVVKTASLTANADLTALQIQSRGSFEKKPGEALKIQAILESQKEDVGLKKVDIRLPFGTIGIGGRIRGLMDPLLDLQVAMALTRLEDLRSYLESMRDFPLSGAMNGHLSINGRMASSQPWWAWPMVIGGNISMTVPKLDLSSSTTKSESPVRAGGTGGAPSPQASSAFLRKGFLTEKLDLSFKARVEAFKKDGLVLNGVTANGAVRSGFMRGTLAANGFGGTIQLKNLVVPLLENNPKIASDVQFNEIKIESILEFLQPAMKDAAKGPSKGDIQLETLMPGAPQFMSALKASGQVGSDNIWINTVQLEALINDQIAKVPGVPKNAVHLDPLQGRLQSRFTLASQNLNPLSIDGFDRSGSELHLNGSANLEQTVDLKGEFRWANAPLSGCLKEGNADDRGRVIVPIALKGPVTSPSWSIATDILVKMGQKALTCEAKKAITNQIQQQLPGGVGEDIGNQIKQLLGH